MFTSSQLNGIILPEKCICLTFDDGPGETHGDIPGPKTLQIAEYLYQQNISATFFFVGSFMEAFPHIGEKVYQYGHTIGNHTFNHVNLKSASTTESTLIEEISKTDELLRPYASNETIYFRAPWGEWPCSAAGILNENLKNGLSHIGPFHWDIEAADWHHWFHKKSAEECATAYLQRILSIKRGIVLFHDSTADLEVARNNNLTYETLLILIPKLKMLGFNFQSLPEVCKQLHFY